VKRTGLTAAWEAHEGTNLATVAPIALLLFSARDTFSPRRQSIYLRS